MVDLWGIEHGENVMDDRMTYHANIFAKKELKIKQRDQVIKEIKYIKKIEF